MDELVGCLVANVGVEQAVAEKAGEDTVGEIVGSIPGLGQFI